MNTKLVMVGGFLGAGKTTLLAQLDKSLTARGEKVGIITNDQATELVDTALLSRSNPNTVEISGSCFCCNFPGFFDAARYLREQSSASVILAEPVGSCTDLSATIMQPLKDKRPAGLIITPFSVLVDPFRLQDLLHGDAARLHPSASYILEKQLDEADIIVVSKADLIDEKTMSELSQCINARWPQTSLHAISSITGDGIDSWYDEVISRQSAGVRLADVNYDIYAEGEAILGWLNTTVKVSGENIQWNAFGEKLLRELNDRCYKEQLRIGHIKLSIAAQGEFLSGNITGTQDNLNVSGSKCSADEATLIINARVETQPERLQSIVEQAVASVCTPENAYETMAVNCLSPGRPNPTYRYDHVI